jgi:hypothetical protein
VPPKLELPHALIDPSALRAAKVLWRFSEVDYSSAFNNFGGFLNAPNYPNSSTFAALKADGSIKAWGNSSFGGKLNKSWYSHYQRVRLCLQNLNYPTP